MRVEVEIPDEFASELVPNGADPARYILETLAVDAYRTNRLSEGQVREILGYETRMQVHQLLKERNVYLQYSLEDFHSDMEMARQLAAQDQPVAA